MTVKNNIDNLTVQIKAACAACGRDASQITLVAVSKTKSLEQIGHALDAGLNNFGENYINEALEKSEALSGMNINWHFIGALQTNKVKQLTKFCSLLHSLDRKTLADELQKRLSFENKNMDVLIQVNTSGEATKSGIAPGEAIEFARYVSTLPNIKVKGLMTIAENSSDEKEIRKNFRELKNLFDELKLLNLPNSEMEHLSMGMSSDFKIAIEEGATILRIGSTIFGEREKKKTSAAEKISKPNRVEKWIYDKTPRSVKNWLNRFVDKLPPRMGNWIRNNRWLTICIIFAFRGLFLRPSMWAVYASIAAYFSMK